MKTSEKRRRAARIRYHERVAGLRESLGGRCSVCGGSRSLEFYRVGEGRQGCSITKVWSYGEARRAAALEGVKLVCRACRIELPQELRRAMGGAQSSGAALAGDAGAAVNPGKEAT